MKIGVHELGGGSRAVRALRPARLALALALAVASCPGCSTTTRPAAPSLSGRVRLVGQLRDADGNALGPQRAEHAGGVRVDLLRGRVVVDSTVTIDGGYRFKAVRSGIYTLRCHGPGAVFDSTLRFSVTTRSVVLRDTLQLASSGEFTLSPNPFSTRTAVAITVASTDPMLLAVTDVSGARVRTLAERAFTLGEHFLLWDGTDDANVPTASGLYWVTFQQGAHFTAELLFK